MTKTVRLFRIRIVTNRVALLQTGWNDRIDDAFIGVSATSREKAVAGPAPRVLPVRASFRGSLSSIG